MKLLPILSGNPTYIMHFLHTVNNVWFIVRDFPMIGFARAMKPSMPD